MGATDDGVAVVGDSVVGALVGLSVGESVGALVGETDGVAVIGESVVESVGLLVVGVFVALSFVGTGLGARDGGKEGTGVVGA